MPTQGTYFLMIKIYMLTTATESKNVLYISEKGNGIAWNLGSLKHAIFFNYRTNASIIVDEKIISGYLGTSERQTELTDVWKED